MKDINLARWLQDPTRLFCSQKLFKEKYSNHSELI